MYKKKRLCTPAFVAGCIAARQNQRVCLTATVIIAAVVVSVAAEPHDYNNRNYNPYKTRAAENTII